MYRAMILLRYALMTLLMLFAVPAAAQQDKPHITATLIAERDTPAPGKTVMVALAMKPEKGWHGYWANPGDAGVGPQFNWTLPAGMTAGPAQFPVPHRLLVGGLMNYVYEGDYAHLIALNVPAGAAPGTKLPIKLDAEWLACTEEVCVPERGSFTLDLTVGSGADAGRTAQFDAWRGALPRPLGAAATFAAKDGMLRLAVPLPASAAVKDGWFFPLTDGAIDYAAPQTLRRDGDTLFVETKAKESAGDIKTIEGIIALDRDKGLWLTANPGPVEPKGAALTAGGDGVAMAGDGGVSLAAAFGLALLGGLLLNIMPCVFPILSLKALSLAKAGGNEASARREALAYTAGIVLVCIALGGALLGLRAAGAAAGWAFQLQDPRVILLLLLLVSAIAFNLAGLFELGSIGFGEKLAAGGGATGAFWTGALAAFIATPCTGPFMGAALGAALVLPTAAALAIFAGLGLGLALPFLLLGFVPALRRRLPKPGAWMDRFRRILSIPMFLTALGLAWILGRQSGVNGMTMGLAAALALGVALWWIGRRQSAGGRGWIALTPALAVAVALMVTLPREAVKAESGGGVLASEPFTETRLAALQGEGKPVFVYFTADWCLTCKVNEKAAIERAEVADAFKAKQVAVLMGDWTDGDPVIGRFIESHGRSGVPLYLFYKPGESVEVLPQVLTPSMLTALAG